MGNQAEEELKRQNRNLGFLKQLAFSLAEVDSTSDISKLLTKHLKAFTGAALVTYSDYNPSKKALITKHIEIELSLIKKIIIVGGKNILNTVSPISDATYQKMVHEFVGEQSSLTEASFGVIPAAVDKAIRMITGVDRFYGVCFVISGELFGASIIGLKAGQEFPSTDLLESFAHLAAVSLRSKKTHEDLLKSEQLYRTLVERMSDGVYKSTHEGRFVEVNPAMVDMLGYDSKEELMQIDIKNQLYFSPADRDELVNEHQIKDLDIYPLKKKDGSAIWIEDHGWYVRDEQGNTLFHEGIMRDVSERKKAQDQLVRQKEELQALNATKDKFFSIIAHDLKSPFQAILGFSDLLLENYQDLDGETVEKSLQAISGASKQAFSLLENLLLWSRSQTGMLTLKPEIIDLREKITTIISLLEYQAVKKNISLKADIQGNLKVCADRNMTGSVLRNLISNAIKFTPQGGKILVNAIREDGHVEISIRDSGVGIAPQNLKTVFMIDGKTSTLGTEKEKGSGLGLIISREFVEKHGGEIWVESEVGKGSTFFFTIPAG